MFTYKEFKAALKRKESRGIFMMRKQELMNQGEGMAIAVTVVLKNRKDIEFVRYDENDYHGILHDYRNNQAALDRIFEKSTNGRDILEGLKAINEYFVYWDLTDKEEEQLNEEFDSIQNIGDVTKIVIQEATRYDSADAADYEKYEYYYSSFNYSYFDFKIEDGVLRRGPRK